MKFYVIIIAIAILLLFFVNGCTVKNVVINNGNGQIEVTVEVADNDVERQTGLMFRESLDENSGMLFLFDTTEK